MRYLRSRCVQRSCGPWNASIGGDLVQNAARLRVEQDYAVAVPGPAAADHDVGNFSRGSARDADRFQLGIREECNAVSVRRPERLRGGFGSRKGFGIERA